MEGKKVPKVWWFVGIFVLIVVISGIIVSLVVYYKTKSSNADEREADLLRYTLEAREMFNITQISLISTAPHGDTLVKATCARRCN